MARDRHGDRGSIGRVLPFLIVVLVGLALPVVFVGGMQWMEEQSKKTWTTTVEYDEAGPVASADYRPQHDLVTIHLKEPASADGIQAYNLVYPDGSVASGGGGLFSPREETSGKVAVGQTKVTTKIFPDGPLPTGFGTYRVVLLTADGEVAGTVAITVEQ